ncbi:MAG: insulinase family protein [Ignavibacteriales bacterium]|nr:insulinase family protein [Ignavibacteriales bacterium]
MKLTLSIQLFLLLVLVMTSPNAPASEFKKGETFHGFKLLEKRFVKEVNAECLYFEHIKSGARLLKIAANDPNKTFSIAFKTDPESDAGTPHIMEHSLLNGSKNFPVKSPFDQLMKGSLITFLNAFTGNDLTCFPFASINDKDYFNVMHVYLDAVFNPLVVSDPRILKQEGWHYEMDSVKAPLVYKGVVYNEMKGSYSNPTRELNYQIYKNLFPNNGYRFTAGGYPQAIPQLTYDKFVKFYKKYYHPVNSYIMLYGNADLDQELAYIDKDYLSKYDKASCPKSFPIQKPFSKMKEVTAFYATAEGSKAENQTYLTFNVVAGLNTDRATTMALNILCDLLVNQEAAPIRLALQKAGIGQDVNASVDELQQNVFQIQVQNANPTDKKKFFDIVMSTLHEVVKNGLDKKAVEGAINRTEFQLREGNDAQKGITYNFQILPGWFFADDPFLTLEYEKPLAKVKTALDSKYFESVIQNYIIKNPHALLLVLEPKPGLEKENNAKTERELKKYRAALSVKAKERLVKETQELVEYQKRENTPEALATIPLLERKDINPKATWYAVEEQTVSDVPVLYHEEFTNDVVYTRMHFDLRALPADLIPYAALLAEVLGSQNTDNYSFGDLDIALNTHTGGFNASIATYLESNSDTLMIPKFVLNAKVMNTKTAKLFELLTEITNHTRYADIERLKSIVTRHQARLDAQVKQDGYGYARRRLLSYFTNTGMLNELINGFEYYWFVTDLATNFDKKSKEISEKLAQTASLLFKKGNFVTALTCGKNDMPAVTQEFTKYANALSPGKEELKTWKFTFEKKNEGFLTASKVQYVMKGYDFKQLGYSWNGKIHVLSQILSSDWLQNRIRVIGGAYGGFSNFSKNGQVIFSSYRDPNLKESLDNYDAIPDYLDKLEVTDKEMTRYIIGTIAGLDHPLTPSQKGDVAVRYYLEKSKPEDQQHERDEVIGTTLSDIKAMRKMVADVLAQKVICVYGNEEKVKAQKDLFGKIEQITH